MVDLEYFDVEGPVSDEERVFLAALRGHIDPRVSPWCPREGGSESGALLVVLDIDAPNLVLLTVGVRLRAGSLHGDRLDLQSFVFPHAPSSLAVDASGPPDALAAVAAGWFDTLLHRPIVHQEWLHDRRVYAQRYVFADTGEPLVQSYDRRFAPPGQPEQLISEGHVHCAGWIQTSGLGPPNRQAQLAT